MRDKAFLVDVDVEAMGTIELEPYILGEAMPLMVLTMAY